MLSNRLILCHPLLLLLSIFPSIRVFSNEFTLSIRWPKYWSFSRVFSSTTIQKHQLFIPQLSLWSNSHMTTGKTIALAMWTLLGKWCLCFFNMLSRCVITFLPRSKCLLISWLQSLSAVILEPMKIKSVTVSIVSPSLYHEVMGLDAMILVFWMLSFKTVF